MVITIEATEEQAQRWLDFQIAEKVRGAKVGGAYTWLYYDVIRFRKQGYTYVEIAKKANCAESTVGRILKKARAMGVNMYEAQGERRRCLKGGIHKCMS